MHCTVNCPVTFTSLDFFDCICIFFGLYRLESMLHLDSISVRSLGVCAIGMHERSLNFCIFYTAALHCALLHCTQVELVLTSEKKIKWDWLGFEPWSLGWKAAMLAPRPQLLHIFFSKSMKVIFNGFFHFFSSFFSLYIIFLGILWIFKAKKTLDSTELYLWDYHYSNLMTHSFYQN